MFNGQWLNEEELVPIRVTVQNLDTLRFAHRNLGAHQSVQRGDRAAARGRLLPRWRAIAREAQRRMRARHQNGTEGIEWAGVLSSRPGLEWFVESEAHARGWR
jgi:hypothetical protein